MTFVFKRSLIRLFISVCTSGRSSIGLCLWICDAGWALRTGPWFSD